MQQQSNSLVAELVNEMRQPNNGTVPAMPLQPGMMPPGMMPNGGGGGMPGGGMPMQGQGMPMQGQGMPMQGQGMPMQGGMPMQYGQQGQGMPMQGQGMPMQDDRGMPMQQGQMGGMAPVSQYDPRMMQQGYNEEDEEEYEEDEMPRGHRDMTEHRDQMDMARFGMEDDKSYIDQIMDALKDPLIIGALFIILSLPQVNRMLIQSIPMIGNNLYYSLGLKAVVMAILFYLVRYTLG